MSRGTRNDSDRRLDEAGSALAAPDDGPLKLAAPAVAPPRSEAELLSRVDALAGSTLAELAGRHGLAVPADQRRAKGFVGELIERALGATAGSRPVPDFEAIGVELKTLPVRADGSPTESTYVCAAPVEGSTIGRWSDSPVRRKLNRVLWLPVQADPHLALSERQIGSGLLWSPSPDEDAELRADWEEIVEQIVLGRIDRISAHQGRWLQLRPKAANASARRWGVDETGARTRTLPRGFYLRSSFTRSILRLHFI